MKKWVFFQLILLFLVCRTEAIFAKDETRILILLSLDVTYPYVKSKVDGLAYEGTKNSKTILLDIQSLEDKRYTDANQLHIYYSKKAEQIKNSRPDIIAITGSPVIFSFYNNYLYPLMPDVPIVGETRIAPKDLKPDAYSFIEYHQNIPKTIDMALKTVNPSAVYLFGDATHPGSKLSMQLVREYLKNMTDVEVNTLDMPFQELLKVSKNLPKDSIGIFNLIFSDGNGSHMIPEDALQAIADNVPFPIFAFHETMIGSGATGGLVAKGENVGIQLIQESLLSLKSGPFNPPRIVSAESTLLFDGYYLNKFNISIKKLPKNSEIINTSPHLIESYQSEIIAVILFILALVFMVVMLFYYFRKKNIIVTELSVMKKVLERRVRERTIKLQNANKTLKIKETEITQLMLTDALTGLSNRRHFDIEFKREFDRSKRTNSDFCIAFCDIDYFKLINDTYGHGIGDKVLVRVAKSIHESIRKTDFVARWGGEEFVIMYIDSDLTTALHFTERVREVIESLEFNEFEESITISIGVTQRKKEDTIKDVIKRSDQALYQAKERGRNCIVSKLLETVKQTDIY